MSQTTTQTTATATPATAAPAFGVANILGSPASTLAGASVILGLLGNTVATTGLPTTTPGWIAFVGSLLSALAAALAKA